MFALPNNVHQLKTLRHILLCFIVTLVIVAKMDSSIFFLNCNITFSILFLCFIVMHQSVDGSH
jgi:hypothetical protein